MKSRGMYFGATWMLQRCITKQRAKVVELHGGGGGRSTKRKPTNEGPDCSGRQFRLWHTSFPRTESSHRRRAYLPLIWQGPSCGIYSRVANVPPRTPQLGGHSMSIQRKVNTWHESFQMCRDLPFLSGYGILRVCVHLARRQTRDTGCPVHINAGISEDLLQDRG